MRATDCPDTTGGLFARLKARLSDDTGDVLMESLAALVIAAITIASFSIAFVNSTHTQRSQQFSDIASQAARGVIEQARSTEYALLGFVAADGAPSTFDGRPTVIAPAATAVTGRITPTQQVTVRGLQVTLNTNIVTSANTRGKDVHVQARYRVPNGETRIQEHVAYVAPAPAEPAAADVNGVTPMPSAGAEWYGD